MSVLTFVELLLDWSVNGVDGEMAFVTWSVIVTALLDRVRDEDGRQNEDSEAPGAGGHGLANFDCCACELSACPKVVNGDGDEAHPVNGVPNVPNFSRFASGSSVLPKSKLRLLLGVKVLN